ncbi:MAG: hypothetical protein AAFQ79_13020 [Pseudomonadota bacterium]
MTRLKTVILNALAILFGLALLGVSASVGLAVLGIAALVGAIAMVAVTLSDVFAKPGKTAHQAEQVA